MRSLNVFSFLVILVIAYTNASIDSTDNTVHSMNGNQIEEVFLRKLSSKCTQRDNHSCMMLKLIVYMNRMFKKSSIEISENMEVTQTRGMDMQNEPDDDIMLARAARSDDETLGMIVAGKLWNFIRTRTLRYKVFDSADIVLATEPRGNLNIGLSISPQDALDKGRGRMKNLAPIIAAVATKVGIIGALAFKGLVLLVGKALIVSKIALLLAIILGLKKLLSKKHVTYEVVSHPHHHEPAHHVHDSYSSGWGRALDGFMDGLASVPATILDAQDLAYTAQKS